MSSDTNPPAARSERSQVHAAPISTEPLAGFRRTHSLVHLELPLALQQVLEGASR